MSVEQKNSVSTDDRNEIEAALMSAAVKRVVLMCYSLALAHFTFCFMSFKFIHKFENSADFWVNGLCRFFLNVVPFLLMALYLKKSEQNPRTKLVVYTWFYALMFAAAASIYVWPIAWSGKPEILLYVGAINSAYVSVTWAIIAPPKSLLFHKIPAMLLFILAPISYIAINKASSELAMIIINDMLFSVALGVGLGQLANRVYRELETLRIKQFSTTSRFLDKNIKAAISKGDFDVLKETVVHAFVVVTDIRNSTNLTKKYGVRWHQFTQEWITEANKVIAKFHGTFVKSTGDGIIFSFGLFDEEEDLPDLPGIETQLQEANDEKWRQLTQDVQNTLDALSETFIRISKEKFPEEKISMGIGIDRGKIVRGLRGDQTRSEFDIWGDAVNIAAKIEAFTKTFLSEFANSSVISAWSPFACDYLPEDAKLKTIDVENQTTLSGIRFVKVQGFQVSNVSQIKLAA